MEITEIDVTAVSTDSWGEFVEFPLVTVMMYRATIPFGRKGAAVEAISAVDLALWDIAGKEVGKPVYELLGGPVTEEIPCYASNLHPIEPEATDGTISLPDGVGLSSALNREALEQYNVP